MDRPAAKVNFLRARDFASRIVTPQQCELLAGCPSHAQCKVLRRSNRGDLLPWITYFGSPLLWVHLHEQTWVNFYERRGPGPARRPIGVHPARLRFYTVREAIRGRFRPGSAVRYGTMRF